LRIHLQLFRELPKPMNRTEMFRIMKPHKMSDKMK
jgi:hypothetical protein